MTVEYLKKPPKVIPEGSYVEMTGEKWDRGTGKLLYSSVLGVYTKLAMMIEDRNAYHLEFNTFKYRILNNVEDVKGYVQL